ncbi:MAG: CRTAC1 family protein [Hyphomonadaceae bacterium]
MAEAKKRSAGMIALLACIGIIGVGGLIALLLSAFGALRFWQAERTPQGETDLSFIAAELPFAHEADLVNSLPFLASGAIDIDGDGRDELFLGGGDRQADQMFAFRDGGFVPLDVSFEKDAIDATHGVAGIDIDNDGDTDIFTARESGIWFHENRNGEFGSERFPLPLADNSTPLSIGLGDINRDGLADMYVAGYIKIELVEGETNFSDDYGGFSNLFLNEGNGEWRDVTREAGVFRQHNTFIGLFADLDNDADSDLIIAQDTGKVEMYENRFGETGEIGFTVIDNPSEYSYPMGVAAGDYDNDGLIDLYFSNVGYTLPPALLRGNLEKDDVFNPAYMLFHNDGGLGFSDTADETNSARYGFGWGVVFADMNLDGYEDLLAAQNYARFPGNNLLARYPGKILQNYGGVEFKPVEKVANAENDLFGISPIVSDFNGDGWPDLVWANLDGPSRAYLSEGGTRQSLTVRLPNNASSLNARVKVTDASGHIQTKQLITSQGLGSDQSRDLVFGLGDAESVTRVDVMLQSGSVLTFDAPAIDAVLMVDVPLPVQEETTDEVDSGTGSAEQ